MAGRVVIIGAGFAGLSAAARFAPDDDVTVISSRPWCEFLPNIHELLSSQKTPAALRLDAEGRTRKLGHRFVLDEVLEVDVASRHVRGSTSGRHPFDALILAVGGVSTTHGTPGADRWSLPFKSVNDCERIAERLRALQEAAGRPRVVIVGAGLEGIEALGEVLRAFPHFHVEVVESSERLLGGTPASLEQTVREESDAFDVSFRVGTRVEAISADQVVVSGGRVIRSDLTMFTGGPKGSPLLTASGVASDGGWAPVAKTLESVFASGVFVAGDAAELEAPISKQAYHAIDMGSHAAENARRWLTGEPLEEFAPAEKPMLVSFGHLGSFLVMGRWAVFGPAVSFAKEAVFQLVSAELVPPTDLEATRGLWRRFAGALPEVGWPGLSTLWQGLAGALDLRILAPDA